MVVEEALDTVERGGGWGPGGGGGRGGGGVVGPGGQSIQ